MFQLLWKELFLKCSAAFLPSGSWLMGRDVCPLAMQDQPESVGDLVPTGQEEPQHLQSVGQHLVLTCHWSDDLKRVALCSFHPLI